MARWPLPALVAIPLIAALIDLQARVVRIEIERREDVLDGRSFGSIGAYEKIIGTVHFLFDPANPMNVRIVDIEKAPRNADGLVGRTPISSSCDRSDVALSERERIYHLASGQHFVGRFPPPADSRIPASSAYRGNHLDFLITMRALLTRMVEWVRDGKEPPPSAYPRIDSSTLVPLDLVRFPIIPGVEFPDVTHVAYRVDYGPRWTQGIIDRQPPLIGEPFPVRVSQVDSIGNEIGGLSAVEILVPLATYAPWNLRTGFPGGADELTDFYGTYVPLPRNEAERAANGDPRPSMEALYNGREDYLRRVEGAARRLIADGVLLEEDLERVLRRAGDHWDWLFTD